MERVRARALWGLAVLGAAATPVVQGAWVLTQDARSLMAGDVAPVLLWLVLLAAPGFVAGALAWRWTRLGGAAVAVWALPRLLWSLEPHLEDYALWPVVLALVVGSVAAGVRWPGRGWPVLALLGALAAMWPATMGTPRDPVGDASACSVAATDAVGDSVDTIVLVTLDTVRADHLATIGGARFQAPTPTLDALAGRGALFTEGVAPAPLTGPAHVAMLSGCDPLGLGVLRNGVAMPIDAPRVAHELQRRGYRTGAFVGASVLDRKTGLDVGFDHYDDRFDVWHRLRATWPRPVLGRLGWVRARQQRTGDMVVERALRWLAEADGPTFLWIHLYDAHHPYDPEPSFSEAVVDSDPGGQGSKADVDEWKAWAKQHHRVRSLPGVGPQGDVSRRLRAYAGEVSEVDALVGRVVAAVPDGAALLVAADHGESLTEHHYLLNHGAHAYQATIRVPFIAVGPGFTPGSRLDTPTPSHRVAGTLLGWGGLDAVGLARPYDHEIEGAIESFAVGQEARRRLNLARPGAELSVREGSTKWLVKPERAWRFDLASDPDERAPVPVAAEALQERLEEIREGGNPLVMRLEALGYVE